MSEVTERRVDALVVGAGPAGLATATELRRRGVVDVEVVERELQVGGIPRHSHHTGFGLLDLHRAMTGPAYARHYEQLAQESGVRLRTGVTATGWSGPLSLDLTSPDGLERLTARTIILATGARERPRSARWVPGSRPEGVYTTGHLQQAVHLRQQNIGTRAVIVGAEHVSYSAAVTLNHANVRVAAMLTELPSSQTFVVFDRVARLRYKFPLVTGVTVTRVLGRRRVEGIVVSTSDGVPRVIACDTVVFTGDWIPDHELARRGGIDIDSGTRGPAVDTMLQTSRPGVFAVGNLVHGVETAGAVAHAGRDLAASVTQYLGSDSHRPSELAPTAAIIRVAPPLQWVAPNRVAAVDAQPSRRHVVLWSNAFVQWPRFAVSQGDSLLFSQRSPHTVVPNRAIHLRTPWLSQVDPNGPPVRIELHGEAVHFGALKSLLSR